jgi:GNAT superfamily N-acetyltransferase
MDADPRVVAVEGHFVELFRGVRSGLLRQHPDTDVLVYTSDLDLPLCSGALAPRFAPGQERHRAHEVLDLLVANGHPFMWWAGSLTRSDAVDAVLLERGLVPDGGSPGMYAALPALDLPAPDPRVEVCRTEEDMRASFEVFASAFEIPDEFVPAFLELWQSLDDGVQLSARVDGEVVGCASGAVIDGVMGVYNVGTLPAARRRGVGRALTAELMRIGARRGCRAAILHASELGHPVYRALGFEDVCEVYRHVWLPATTVAA